MPLVILLTIAGLHLNHGIAAGATSIVYPDTLGTPHNRYTVLPAMRPLRKTVGLALSGGGANGITQIGVLKALEEENIPIDFIAGTSMGALIGGLYSSGYSASELESIALALPWQKLTSLDDDAPRSNSYLEQKNIRDRATIAIRFEKFQLVVPKSLSSAQTLSRTIDLLILNAPYHTTYEFSDLPVSFRAVATDLISGERVTMSSGHLSEAMRASSTIPILFQPIERYGKKLADGGLVANLPVDELDNFGAGYKVAVDSHGKMYTEGGDLDIPWKAADQAMTILTQIQYPQQLDQADIVISPEIGQHKATDFSDISKLIAAGYAKGKLLSSTIRRNIQVTGTRDIDIARFTKTIHGISEAPEYIEQMRMAKAIIRNETQVKKILRELLATDMFTHVHAELDESKKEAVFVLVPLPRINSIEVTGGPERPLEAKEIENAFISITGKLYTNTIATRSLEKLIMLYRKNGYSLVEIERTSVSGDKLTVRLSSGKISSVNIEQDRKITREMPIRRETVVDTTKTFRLKSAEMTIDNLYGTGVFNRVSLSAEASDPPLTLSDRKLNIKLYEKPATVLRLGVRYDETLNAQLLVDLRNENLGGSANSIGGWAKLSEKNYRVNLELSIPRIGSTPLTMFSKAFFDQREIETRQLALTDPSGIKATGEPRSFGIQRYGITTAFGTRIQKNGRLVADITLQNARSYLQDNLTQPFATGNNNMLSLGSHFTLDTRDSSFLPTEGRYINIRYSSTLGVFNNVLPFWQFVGSHEEDFKISSGATIQLSFLGGTSNNSVPLSEKFFLGGVGNAYSYRFIGLKDNDLIGNNIAMVGALLRYKSPLQIIFPTSFTLAYNIGNVWERRELMSLSQLVQGAGAGLVWETPIGPARFTVAKPFAFESRDVKDAARINFSETVFYFSLGHDF
ncbi:MAG TPA: BamA/TamA family outer membrane protein [Chlorobaculum sp.]|nr:BamA/TamA family outer membrane protein [Chlorobaculum sp.]